MIVSLGTHLQFTGKGMADNAGFWRYMEIFETEKEALDYIKAKFTPGIGG